MTPALLQAPAHWQSVEFVSDLHLQPRLEKTRQGLVQYLQHNTADAVFLLGDVFEVWVGDDSASSGFAAQGLALLQAAAQRQPLYFMAGNRDFLLSAQLLQSVGITWLADPTVFEFGGERFLLSHGDQFCIDDLPSQKFRQMVRDPQWQAAVLSRPLAERLALAQNMREQSSGVHSNEPNAQDHWIDLNPDAVRQALNEADATTLIHGHTHAPTCHALGRNARGQALTREVLSDWDLDAPQPRAEVFRLSIQASAAPRQPVTRARQSWPSPGAV